MSNFGERLKGKFGHAATHWSCLGRNGLHHFTAIIEEAFGKRDDLKIVEIGTHRGVSASILARYGNVETFDIKDWDIRDELIEFLGMTARVKFTLIPCLSVEEGNAILTDWLKHKTFDLAFIDGNHAYDSVLENFEAVKHCGTVIFHDYNHNQFHELRTVEFVDSIPDTYGGTVVIMGLFAMWRRDA